ncbi:glycosyltransferase [Chitinophaga japonensis]|uniref:Glycosyltransferase involved in cell wall biosynthesis n=1 Tax=Chitinophaga japonensis TaxID=104662 RepID=A0A562T3V2_CHIJA|nr:glycosyltransferase [Chitinophaga japonensis]TWI88221.1 glycosyltransferase involved in cell wall biosynthesis [Chitinophaga japonensis]
MVNILHIGEFAGGGGDGTVFRNTVQALEQAPFRGRCRNYVACRKTEGLAVKVDLDMGFPGPVAFLSHIYSRGNFRKLKKFLLEIQPDIIHLQHYSNLSPAVLHALYSYKKRRPEVRVVQTTHTFERVCANFAGYDFRKRKRCMDCARDKYKYRIFYRLCSRGGAVHSWGKGLTALIADFFYNKGLVDSIIAPSAFLRHALERSVNNRTPLQTISNPISDAFLNRTAPAADKRDLLVAFGRLSGEKNYALLIEALARYKQQYYHRRPIRVKIIGEGAEKPRLVSMVKEKGLEFVQFLPFLPQEELAEEIKAARVAVLPSKCFETFALFVIEALMMDILPLVAGHGGMLETVERFGCGATFASDDVHSLTERLFHCFENYEALTSGLVAAKEKIKASLGRDLYAGKLWEVYRG